METPAFFLPASRGSLCWLMTVDCVEVCEETSLLLIWFITSSHQCVTQVNISEEGVYKETKVKMKSSKEKITCRATTIRGHRQHGETMRKYLGYFIFLQFLSRDGIRTKILTHHRLFIQSFMWPESWSIYRNGRFKSCVGGHDTVISSSSVCVCVWSVVSIDPPWVWRTIPMWLKLMWVDGEVYVSLSFLMISATEFSWTTNLRRLCSPH